MPLGQLRLELRKGIRKLGKDQKSHAQKRQPCMDAHTFDCFAYSAGPQHDLKDSTATTTSSTQSEQPERALFAPARKLVNGTI